MKKLLTLAVAMAMVLGSLSAASAVDVKVNGQYWFWYNYASNQAMQDKSETGSHADRTAARQRMRFQIQFIADENLSAMLAFESDHNWGAPDRTTNSGGLDSDYVSFETKRAHLDWTLPSQTKIRMGIQGIALPVSAFSGNPVLNADVAGVSVSHQFTPAVGLTAFWARPYDQNIYVTDAQDGGTNSLDEMDAFGLMLPVKTNVINVTPWAMIASIGQDSGFFTRGPEADFVFDGDTGGSKVGKDRAPAYNDPTNSADFTGDGTSVGTWFGAALDLPIIDPFFFRLDGMWGKVNDVNIDGDDMTGWMAGAEFGYKFNWGALSLRGFYSSGNDDEEDMGQLPIISNDAAFNMAGAELYGLSGNDWRRYDGFLSVSGLGMWGLGLRLGNLSFVDSLTHTVNAMYYGGTNDDDAAGLRTVRADGNKVAYTERALGSSDNAWELSLINTYKVNNNLSLRLDVAYVQLDLDDENWDDEDAAEGNFTTGIGVMYSF